MFVGHTWKSELLDWNQVHEDNRHLDYFPLVNSRAHQLHAGSDTQKSSILNKNFKETYNKFLITLIKKFTPSISEIDKLQLVYYFLL